MAQWVEQLTCIQEIVGLNPAGEQIFFFRKSKLMHTRFLEFSFDDTVTCTWNSKEFQVLEFQARIEMGLE